MIRDLQFALAMSGIQPEDAFPREIASIAPLHLPLAFIRLPELSTGSLSSWLLARKIPARIAGLQRRLHGALAARAGRGLVFIDATDDPAEQRFTEAHETAHFIHDHLLPRIAAIKAFGTSILPVLDCTRPPSPEESLSAVLNRVPLGVQLHLMDRTATGVPSEWVTESSEQNADRLALEMLAPSTVARRILRKSSPMKASSDSRAAVLLLIEKFGLPASAAVAYAQLLFDQRRSRPKLSEVLLGDTR